jgi:2-succinyl-5-enolpyruvyl-6-hydroxy-3-cyclohexene-1-carboxylate synthase
MAIQLKRPIAIACTSGSAMLNYAPAIAEAYYQKVPLLILTADRPPEWVDQNDGQTIRQQNAFRNFIKSSYSLIEQPNKPDEEWYLARDINQAVNDLTYPECGPVHINMPLSEPLYKLEDVTLCQPKIITISGEPGLPSVESMEQFATTWNNSNKKLVLAGQMAPQKELNGLLNKLSIDHSIIVLTETTSNLNGEKLVTCIDNVLSSLENEANYAPDLLITMGGQIVSKKIKTFLRKYKPASHWHFSKSAEHIDTYQSLTDIITADPVQFISKISQMPIASKTAFGQLWNKAATNAQQLHQQFLANCEFSDLKVFEAILNKLPGNSVLHLSNSTPIRYSQLFTYNKNITFQSNRGTSGIDGVLSTAAGVSFVSDKINTVIMGDLAFFYDSNAIWNKHLTDNLRIIVINNGGGGIFRFLDGPSLMPELETHFEAQHGYSAASVAKAYNIESLIVTDGTSVAKGLDWLFSSNFEKPALLEILTPTKLNAEILKGYFKFLKG